MIQIFPDRLVKARKMRRMTQTELAKKSGVSFVAHFETGLRMPSMETFDKLVRALDVSADYLLGISDMPAAVISNEVIAHAVDTLSKRDLEILNGLIEILLKRQGGKKITRPN